MSILFIAGEFPPGSDEISVYLYNLAAALSKKKKVVVLALKKHSFKEFDKSTDLEVVRAGSKRGGLTSIIAFHRAAARICIDRKIEHIIAGPWNPGGVAAMNVSLKTGIGYSLILFGDEIKKYIRNKLSVRKLKKIFERSSNVFCISEHSRMLLSQLSISPDKVKVIYGGGDHIGNQAVKEVSADDIKKELQIVENEKLIFSTGRMERKYAFDILLWAVYLLRQKNKNFKLLILGDGPEKAKLKTIIEDLRIGDYVKIIHQDEKLNDYYNACDIYIQLGRGVKETHSAPLGISILESAFFAKPSIVSESCMLSEIIEDSKNGFRVPPLKPVETAAAIKNLLNSDQAAMQMGEIARKLILSKFNWDNTTDIILNSITSM